MGCLLALEAAQLKLGACVSVICRLVLAPLSPGNQEDKKMFKALVQPKQLVTAQNRAAYGVVCVLGVEAG